MGCGVDPWSVGCATTGHQKRFEHTSEQLGCTMKFGVYLPETPAEKIPVLYFLSGLTCTDENVVIKVWAMRRNAPKAV